MAPDEVSEEELINRFREGDGEALCALFDRYQALLESRAARYLSPHIRRRHSLSDVLQEARLVAFERRADFEPRDEASLRNWLLEIVTRKARRAVQRHDAVAKRSTRREVTRTRRPPTGELRGSVPTPSQVAIAAELAELTRRALGTLPEGYREVLRLALEEQRSLKEIAVITGRSYEAAKKLYGRALTSLSRALKTLRGESRG